jgi:hypothetical protein
MTSEVDHLEQTDASNVKPSSAETSSSASEGAAQIPTEERLTIPRPMSKAERLAVEKALKKQRKPGRAAIAIATGAGVLVTGVGIGIGIGLSGRGNNQPSNVPTAAGSVTPGSGETASASPTTPETTDSPDSYKGPIPTEQLVIHEPTKSYEQLNAINDVNEFAHETPENRALWGYNFASELIKDNTAGVETNDNDESSFDDANFTGGGKTLTLMNNIYAHLGGVSETDARKLALAFNYDPLDPKDPTKIFSGMETAMDNYAAQAAQSGDIPIPYARKETPWKLTPDMHGKQEWAKAVYYQTKRLTETTYGGDRTSQLVRMTIKDPETGNVDVWTMYGNSIDGDELDKLGSEAIR